MQCRLEVRNIRVRSLSIDFNEIAWEVASTSEDILDYTFQVLRSEAGEGPYEEVSPPLEDLYFFLDNRVKAHNRWRQWHYKIRVVHKPSGESRDFGPKQFGGDADLIATEIRKHLNLLFREFVGRRCWILPVRTFGQRCPDCFNETLKQRTRSGCLTCFDTGWVRGYHSPVESFVQIDPSPETNQQTNVGEIQQSNTTARLGFYPPLKPKDVIIEPDNRRWRVTQKNSTQRLRVDVHQEVQLHEIPKGDVEYCINFDLGTEEVKTVNGTVQKTLGIKDLFLAGARNYTNPHTLENFERDEIPGIYALYPSTYAPVKT